ncbi:MAG TPA: cupin domain-containing protein [Bacteroidales bacterium]|nr:cupin domain-containing protein [Bacteroidales bacterium]
MDLKVIRIDEVKGVSPDPFRMSWQLISEKMVDAQNLSMGLNETYPGGMVPEHTHETEEEVNFVFSGRGKFVAEGKEFPIEPGICIYTPPGIAHKIVNDGDEVIRFMWIFAPQLANHRK